MGTGTRSGLGVGAAALLFTSVAGAQPVSATTAAQAAVPGAPPITWFDPLHVGDTVGPSGSLGPGGSRLFFEPLRLGLLGPSVPRAAIEPGCAESPAMTGAATGASSGFSPGYASALRIVPKLTLYGFSRGGCAIDTAAGGGLVFTQPIAPKLWLIGSAGGILLPQNGPGGTPVRRAEARFDLLIERTKGTSLTVGISTRGVSFGGVF